MKAKSQPFNSRVTAKERGLLKGAIRRVFSRSELRKEALDRAKVEHHDPKRPRVKKWVRCEECKELTPAYLADVDHKNPIVAIDSSFDEQGADKTIDKLWCNVNDLAILDKKCHTEKTKRENKIRRQLKKERLK